MYKYMQITHAVTTYKYVQIYMNLKPKHQKKPLNLKALANLKEIAFKLKQNTLKYHKLMCFGTFTYISTYYPSNPFKVK